MVKNMEIPNLYVGTQIKFSTFENEYGVQCFRVMTIQNIYVTYDQIDEKFQAMLEVLRTTIDLKTGEVLNSNTMTLGANAFRNVLLGEKAQVLHP